MSVLRIPAIPVVSVQRSVASAEGLPQRFAHPQLSTCRTLRHFRAWQRIAELANCVRAVLTHLDYGQLVTEIERAGEMTNKNSQILHLLRVREAERSSPTG